ncbi:MAG: hypothetical protein NTY53_25035, partial [Kiritimatiellaeota bacterium]|nr:hypothetical protein [Kiritimatiellota bacterium]
MKTQCSLPSTGTFSKLWKNVPSFFPSLGKTSPVFSQVLEKSAFRLSPSTALVRLRSPQVRSGNPWKTSLSRAAAALILGAGLWLGAVFAADQALTLDELLKRQDLERLALQAKYQQPKATESTASEAFQKQQEACRAEKKNLAAKHAQELRAFQPTPDASTVDASTLDASTMDASRPPSTPSATAPVESGLTPEAELVAMKERALRLVREHHERLIDQNGLRNQKNTPEYHELLKHYEDSVAMVEQNFVRDGSPPPPKDAPPVTSMSDYYAGQRKLTELKLNDPLLRRDTSVKKGVQIVGQSAEKVGILVQKPDGSWAVDEGKLAVIDPELGQADKAFWGKVQKIKNGSSLVEAGVYKPEMSPGAREEVIREFNQKLHAAMPSLEEHLQQLLPHDSAAESAAVKFHLEKEPMIDAGRVAGWGIPAEKPAHSPVQANVGGGAPHNANNISVQQQHDMVELENYLQAHGVNNNKPRSGSAQAHVPGGKDPALVAAEKLYAENAERLKALQPQQLGSGHAAADQNLSGLFDINANVKELKSKYGPYASGISEELKKGRQSEAQIIADIKVGRLKPDAHDPAHVAGAGQSSGERPGLFDWDGKWKPQYLNEAILEAHAQGRSEAQIVADIKVGKIKLDPLVAEQSGQKNVANQSPSQSDSRSPVQVQGKDLPDYLQKGTPANKALNDVLQSAKNQRAQGIQAARAKAINQFQRDMLQQGRKPTDPEYIKAEQKLAGDLKQIGPGPEDQLLDAQLKNGRLGGQKSASVSKSSV